MKLPTKSKDRSHAWNVWVVALCMYVIARSPHPWFGLILIGLYVCIWLMWFYTDHLSDKLRKLRGDVKDLQEECARKGIWP